MTDNDIIKALECIANEKDVLCKGCAYKQYDGLACHRIGARNALALINNQTAKIKALQMDNAQLQSDIINATQNNDHIKALYEEEKQKVEKAKQKVIDSYKMLKTAKSEARKEFAERLKTELTTGAAVMRRSTLAVIDDVLKELEDEP